MPLVSRAVHKSNQRVSHTWSMAVPASHLWWGLTDSEALQQWLGQVTSGEFVTGGAVVIQHGEDYCCTSRILECEPEKVLSLTWKFPDEPLSHVRIVLTPGHGSTQLTLNHDGLGGEAANYLPGWHTHLLYLEDLLLGHPRSMANFWSTYDELVGY